MKEIVVNLNNSGQRLDKYLIKLLPLAGKSFIFKMLRKKNITLNNKKAEGMEIIKQGDVIKIFFSDETYNKFANGNNSNDDIYKKAFMSLKGIKVIFENENIIALSKPAGVLCQTDNKNDVSINEWLCGYLINNGFKFDNYKPSASNRIDCNTTGIVLCAKTYKGSRYLFDVISNHKVEKYYLALCEGVIDKKLELKAYLSKDAKTNKVRILNDGNKGDYIETIIEPVANNGKISLLKIRIITGKSHQIRAHLSSINHPLLGDIKYGGQIYKGYKHQLLHAYNMILPYNESVGIDSSNNNIVCKPEDIYFEDLKVVDIK